MNWFKSIFKKNVGAPVHSGANRVWFTDVWEDKSMGYFHLSTYDDKHTDGTIKSYPTLELALFARSNFVEQHKRDQFVHLKDSK